MEVLNIYQVITKCKYADYISTYVKSKEEVEQILNAIKDDPNYHYSIKNVIIIKIGNRYFLAPPEIALNMPMLY